MDIKNVGLAILVGSVVTGLLSYPLWFIAPLIGGVIAGFLTKNGSDPLSDLDKRSRVGILSGVLGAWTFIIFLRIFSAPLTEGSGVYVIVLLFAGPFMGYIGGSIVGFARNTIKPKKHLD